MVPSPDANPSTVTQYRPEEALAMLGLQVKVNEQLVEDLSFTVGEQLSALFGDKTTAKADKQTAKTPAKPVVSYTYQTTAMGRLPQYIGAQLKISLTDGKLREGTLMAINQNDLLLEQRMHGGTFELYVPKDKIVDVKVLRLLRE